MSGRLPPLSTLRVFDAVARHLSFTRAAGELGMTQAAVSYQIKQLEERIGRPVFQRMTRRLALSEAGEKLAPAVAEAFTRLNGAFDALHDDGGGVLSVTAVNTFTTNWLVPRIGRFQVTWPNIAVRLETLTRLVDFAREDYDVGIRGGRVARGSWPGLASHYLGSIDLVPMCSPALLAEIGGISTPRDLLALPLMGELGAPHQRYEDWKTWFRLAGLGDEVVPAPRAHFATQQMLGAAAAAGQGMALLTPAFFQTELQTGKLVQVLPIALESVETYYLVYLASRAEVPKIKAFREWVLAETAADRSEDGPRASVNY